MQRYNFVYLNYWFFIFNLYYLVAYINFVFPYLQPLAHLFLLQVPTYFNQQICFFHVLFGGVEFDNKKYLWLLTMLCNLQVRLHLGQPLLLESHRLLVQKVNCSLSSIVIQIAFHWHKRNHFACLALLKLSFLHKKFCFFEQLLLFLSRRHLVKHQNQTQHQG